MIKASATGVLTTTLSLAATFAAGFVIASSFDASAHVVTEDERASPRIEGAFEAVSQAGIETGFTGQAQLANCAAAVWPNIDASCLQTADGSTPPSIRVVY